MQKYMAVPPGYSPSDIARLLKNLYEEVLRTQQILLTPLFVGREDFCNRVIIESRSKPAQTGTPINFLILASIFGMGRQTIAKQISSKIFPGSRMDSPVFELKRHSDAIDLFLALRQDITGNRSGDWLAAQIEAFPEDQTAQADLILSNLMHFANINQTVIIRSAYGLRQQSTEMRPWLAALIEKLVDEPNVRVIWLSDRLLPPEAIHTHNNVLQFPVPELSNEHIVYMLSELMPGITPLLVEKVAPYLHGHPASAHYFCSVFGTSLRGIDTFFEAPDTIRSFQLRCAESAISRESIGVTGQRIVSLLRLLPSADYDLIRNVFSDEDSSEIRHHLWLLSDNCIVTYNSINGYKLSELIRGVYDASETQLNSGELSRLATILEHRLEDQDTNLSTIEALIFLNVKQKNSIPNELKRLLTGSMLLELVDQYYQAGHRMQEGWQSSFRTAARLALLASEIRMSPDALETILFNGADALIRIGDDPQAFIEYMQARKLPAVNYILASHLYYQKQKVKEAILYLEEALRLRSYTKRTTRLLARAYMDLDDPLQALTVFDRLGERKVN